VAAVSGLRQSFALLDGDLGAGKSAALAEAVQTGWPLPAG
jgi:hypothetical protein